MMKITSTLLGLVLAASAPLSAIGADDMTTANSNTANAAPTAGIAPLADGEIKKVDKEASKITIKHGPLANLSMPAMTMVFRVKDPAMLDQVKSGNKVKFLAEKVNGALTITTMQAAK